MSNSFCLTMSPSSMPPSIRCQVTPCWRSCSRMAHTGALRPACRGRGPSWKLMAPCRAWSSTACGITERLAMLKNQSNSSPARRWARSSPGISTRSPWCTAQLRMSALRVTTAPIRSPPCNKRSAHWISRDSLPITTQLKLLIFYRSENVTKVQVDPVGRPPTSLRCHRLRNA